jgi:hypothetical protein
MNYSLGNMLGRRGGLGALDPDAAAFISAVAAAGATVSTTQRTAIDSFVKAEKTASRWTLHKRIYLPIWGVASPNAIDMVGLASGSFVGGVTQGAGFVQGNGTSGYFNFNVDAQTLGVTASLGTYFALVQQADTNTDARTFLGTTNGISFNAIEHFSTTQARMFFGNSTINLGQIQSSAFASRADQTGIFTGSYDGITRNLRVRKASGASSRASVIGIPYNGPDSTNITAMCLTSIGTPVRFHNGRLGAYGVSLDSSVSGIDAFTSNLKTLWETCTGLTLP